MTPISPLRHFHLGEYSNVEEYCHHLALKVGPRTVEFPGGTRTFRHTVNFAPMRQLELFAFGHHSDVIISAPSEDIYRYQICRVGGVGLTSRRASTCLKPGHAAMITSRTDVAAHYGPDSEHIVLRAQSDVLKDKLQVLIGARATREIVFDDDFHLDTRDNSILYSLASHLIAELDAGRTLDSTAAIELESMVVTMFLLGKRHNFSGTLAAKPQSIAPFQIRLAEEYIEANWDRPVTIKRLTEVTGVSARSLFERFQSYRGISPIAFLRKKRLERAREILMSPKPDTTVTGVALKCGFLNTGQFARYYREMFGELPSKALAASRSLAPIVVSACIGITANVRLDTMIRIADALPL